MNASFYTLGCKVNQYETQAIKESFVKAGFDIIKPSAETDIFVVNSCTVTAVGDKKTRNMLSRYKKMNPNGIVAVTGCYSQAFPEEVSSLKNVDIITGTRNKSKIIDHVQTFMKYGSQIVDVTVHTKEESLEKMSITTFGERTRAFVKIQDGCDNRCTYCIIPKARGAVCSKTPNDIIAEITDLAKSGFKEVVLVGINLCFYGRDIGKTFADAIEAACSVEGISRVRLSSLEPELISDEDLDRMAALPKLCPSFHLALQSGSDRTLKAMARRYDTNEYYDIVKRIREKFKNPSFTTDFMIGFPGETDEDFCDSIDFLRKVKFCGIHPFSYSIRPGTPAAKMKDHVAPAVKSARMHTTLEVAEQLKADFLSSMIGEKVEIIVESRHQDGYYEGFSDNYACVKFKCEEAQVGSIVSLKIISSDTEYCYGEAL